MRLGPDQQHLARVAAGAHLLADAGAGQAGADHDDAIDRARHA
jgi:hypothetical protein